ncbi:MAG: hypothetical protein L0207_03735 [Chlamydiae bacterium]|nr:hypothetical protein [Chlamydiota bacterium]
MKKIKEFEILMDTIKSISDEEYQQRIWVRHENLQIVDSYDDTTMYFLGDAEAILNATDAGRVEMTDRQYQLLKELYEKVDKYDMQTKPNDDKRIVNDPDWHKIREFAKKVYEELSK